MGRAEGLGSDTAWSLLEDREGGIWVGTYRGGVRRFVGDGLRHFTSAQGLRGDVVRCVLEDRRGDLWIGTDRGVCRHDGGRFGSVPGLEALADDFVLWILEDRKGAFWFGTLTGVKRWDGERCECFGAPEGWPETITRQILEDREGTLWFTAGSAGLVRYDGERARVLSVDDGLTGSPILTVFEDREGALWVGTETGVCRYEGGRFEDLTDRVGAPRAAVYSIAEDGAGNLWFAAYGHGVVRCGGLRDGRDPDLDSITEADGLATNQVVSLIFDTHGDLWVGTEVGGDRLDMGAYRATGSKDLRHLGPEDGFLGVECVHNAAAIDRRGDLWFGTSEGLTRVRPEPDLAASVPPLTHITEVLLFHGSEDLARHADGVDAVTGLPEGLELPHDRDHLTFRFRGLALDAPERVRYRYRLRGFDEEWSPESGQDQANYSSLAPGDYEFEVRARSAAGFWSEDPARFSFVIRRPFWGTWWFRLGALAVVASGTFALIAGWTRHRVERRARAELESKVQERTEALARANATLHEEIERRKELEEEALKAEKLESLGVLAGGIAHGFNNFLTAIVGNLSLARNLVEPGSDVDDPLEQAERASARARDLTQQLQAFSKGGSILAKRSLPAGELVREVAEFALSGFSVRTESSVAPDVWSIDADATRISQVLHNVILNAQQSMPRGGVVKITCENVTIRSGERPRLAPGPYVRIRIQDHGVGIPPESRTRIFDPYFTTKDAGSGLGLALTHSILRQHQGDLYVESEEGVGSTFILLLPAGGTPEDTTRAPTPGAPGAGWSILVMDDESAVRETLTGMLERLGYAVDSADCGEQAIEVYRAALARGKPHDLVMLDLTIPGGMGGRETLRELLGLDPSVRAIASSGYSVRASETDFSRDGFAGVLPKPYRLEELRNALAAALEPEWPSVAEGEAR